MNFTEHKRTTIRHRVGKCPACRVHLWAEVDLTTTVSPPTLSEDGQASVYASARPIAMRLDHDCDQEKDQ